jgi:hypothetical protein
MWQGWEEALVAYGVAICREWRRRSFADTVEAKLLTDAAKAGVTGVRSQSELAATGELPPWLGDQRLHRSHRSALVRKDREHYRAAFPDVADDLDYHWPVRVERAKRRPRRG